MLNQTNIGNNNNKSVGSQVSIPVFMIVWNQVLFDPVAGVGQLEGILHLDPMGATHNCLPLSPLASLCTYFLCGRVE